MDDFFEIVVAFAILGIVLVSLILPWANRKRIGRMERTIERLSAELHRLQNAHAEAAAPEVSKPERVLDEPMPTAAPVWSQPVSSHSIPEYAPLSRETMPLFAPRPARKGKGFEQQVGGRLAVWAGGIALALAGFFLVKYSIKIGLLTPPVRVVLGAAFGFALLQGGRRVGVSTLADNVRIAQALVGAGIASLYASAYTATSVYMLIPSFEGFLAMIAVTGIAVTMSMRHGAPIAVLGMLGGDPTPALIDSPHPNAMALFVYLTLLTGGLMAALSYRGWCKMQAASLGFALLWAFVWVSNYHPDDATLVDAYLMAIGAIVAFFSNREEPATALSNRGPRKWLPVTAIGIATALGAWTVTIATYSLSSIALYWVIAAAGIALAVWDNRRYAALPFVSAIGAAALIAGWGQLGVLYPWLAPAAPERIVEVACAFAILHLASGHVQMLIEAERPSGRPLPWALAAALSAVLYFLAAWVRLHSDFTGMGFPVWGPVAMGMALMAIEATRQIATHVPAEHPMRMKLLAVGAGMATAFISLGFTIEIGHDFLPVAVAGEVLALSWIALATGWPSLRYYAATLAVFFIGLLLPQFLLLLQVVLFSLTESPIDFGLRITFAEHPLFQLGLPALLFAGASILLRRRKDDWIVASLEALSAALLGLGAYYLVRTLFHAQVLFTPATFLERGVNTNALFLCGLLCLWVGHAYQRKMVSQTGLLLAGIALFRIVFFDLLFKNPLWSAGDVGTLPLLNWLLLPYGLPILWIAVLRSRLAQMGWEALSPVLNASMLVLAFTLVSTEVRQVFHGPYLYAGGGSDGEVYAYSAAWLALGLGLLFLGTLKRDRMLRLASLGVMVLTVGKVFLFDAANLDGLLRVFSFMGLGLSLLGLSWFYSRFVFAASQADDRQDEAANNDGH